MRSVSVAVSFLIAAACSLPSFAAPLDASMAEVTPEWSGEVLAQVDQSYAGWDVEIGDADNDGRNEILTTGCPDSRLYCIKNTDGTWQSQILAENLAQHTPGMGLAVRVVDINKDRKNEIILGTGQESAGTAFFYLFETDGQQITRQVFSRPDCNKSGYTHNFAVRDLDRDGVDEVISAYCGGGEIIRYDLDSALATISARKIHQLSGSGEESLIADVDNDGKDEFITANGFRAGKARVEIFEFDDKGELLAPPRIALDGVDGQGCFYASIQIGDLDHDGRNEMAVGWKHEQKVNKATLIVYRVEAGATPLYVLDRDTEDLDMAYFEKMMAIADADNDGKNELIISTRGDNQSEFITSRHLGRVYRYSVSAGGTADKQLLVDFSESFAESSWLAVGDADNDGKNEVILATGKGDRTKPGTASVVMLKKRTP